MKKPWNADTLMDMSRAYQPAAVLLAAAELEIFDLLREGGRTAEEIATVCRADLRGMVALLDALAAGAILIKQGDQYLLPKELVPVLTSTGSGTMLAMLQHQANCFRRWGQLATVVKNGLPAERHPSIRGEAADQASFIGAMDNISSPLAARVIREIGPPPFENLLDVGGASGTWTMALLQAMPQATATIFDLPHVQPMAEHRMAAAGLTGRVRFIAGDFEKDTLPGGADLAWVSAIVHQNSRAENRCLFNAVHRALEPGGQLLVRDILMEPSRTSPAAGALFAINMLVGTQGGGTYTFEELRDDLTATGFGNVEILRRTDWMDSVIAARKPG